MALMHLITGVLFAVQMVRALPSWRTPLTPIGRDMSAPVAPPPVAPVVHSRLILDGVNYIPELSVKKPSLIRNAVAGAAVGLLVGGAVLTAGAVQRQKQIDSDKKKGARILSDIQSGILGDNAADELKGPVSPLPGSP